MRAAGEQRCPGLDPGSGTSRNDSNPSHPIGRDVLPTPPRCDAVAFAYMQRDLGMAWTFTSRQGNIADARVPDSLALGPGPGLGFRDDG